MTEQKVMGRTIFSSFILAGAVILAAAFLAPGAGQSSDVACNSAYGINTCSRGLGVKWA